MISTDSVARADVVREVERLAGGAGGSGGGAGTARLQPMRQKRSSKQAVRMRNRPHIPGSLQAERAEEHTRLESGAATFRIV